ncbi:PspA/IM30 family protein [Alicyclobacillus sp. SO9]|uniref:PspA/IM30 family protein n=1 Tax=Alicyclobacillus sp. SO9 TaxID=2665646 RepID=UPI0018E89556|nr:PspA/IM30 family protein [Alicyclobacillus sp. SO9]QQE76882.1 PspA/IM30 family protein [Alicyclobacillus sp. SO9]
MALFKRLKDVTLANINAILDKAEDPEKMVDQYLRDMEDDLVDVEKAVATAIANKMKFEKKVQDEKEMVEKREQQAMKALEQGNEDLARRALEDKKMHQDNLTSYENQYATTKASADKLQHQLQEMKHHYQQMLNKRDILKARAQTAKAEKEINQSMSGIGSDNAVKGFGRMEDRITQMEAEASASESMMDSNKSLDDELDALDKSNVDDELAALKAKMNKAKE